jgi:elongation factor Ts
MAITADTVKKLRDKTNAGMMDCKRALEESQGDLEKAIEILRKRGLDIAAKKSSRATKEGVVGAYIHSNKKVGVLIEVGCESDFVAKNDQFQELVRDLTLQIASAVPRYVSRDDIPAEIVEREKAIYSAQVTGKPANVLEKIVSGKLEKFFKDVCLVDQPFVKDDKRTINDVIKEHIATLGENIVVRRFLRYQVGEEL